MLELAHDRLRFSFPEIASQLRALVEEHIATHLPRVLAEDRATAADHALREDWRCHNSNAETRSRFRREAAAFTEEQITRTFRRLAFRAASLSEGTDAGSFGCGIEFQRTLRIPDDGKDHPLPAGLGRFALRAVDDFLPSVPGRWRERGGVMLPMYQAEAMWMNFDASYPCAVKIAAGKVNAVSGEGWQASLNPPPKQDYVALPRQPWLDGFSVGKGVIRQFVAMPLGGGHSVEEQVTGAAEHGGVQIQVYPVRAEIHFDDVIRRKLPTALRQVLVELIDLPMEPVLYDLSDTTAMPSLAAMAMPCAAAPDMGLGAGGRMRQEIYEDKRSVTDYDRGQTSRCFVHLCNSLVWREITGSPPPQPPVTAAEYAQHGLKWYDYYNEEARALPGSSILAKVKSVFQIGKEKGEAPLPGDGPVVVKEVVSVGPALRPGQVREWTGE